MFVALRDEIDPTIASISSLLTAISFVTVMLVAVNIGHGERKRGKRA
jgi:putative spermidine/putrescine transport system permease protein